MTASTSSANVFNDKVSTSAGPPIICVEHLIKYYTASNTELATLVNVCKSWRDAGIEVILNDASLFVKIQKQQQNGQQSMGLGENPVRYSYSYTDDNNVMGLDEDPVRYNHHYTDDYNGGDQNCDKNSGFRNERPMGTFSFQSLIDICYYNIMLRQRATNGSSATKLGKDLNGRIDIRTHHGISRNSSKNKSRKCSSCLKLISFAAICAVLVMLGKGYYPFDKQNSEKVIQVKKHVKGKKSNTRGARKNDAPKKIDDKNVGKNEKKDMKKTANDKDNKPKHVSDMKNKVPKKSTDTHVGDVTTDNGTETADKHIGGNEKNMKKKSSDINVGDNKKNIPKSIDKHSTTNKNNDPKKTTDKHIGGSGNNDSEKVIDKSHGAASVGKVFPSPFPEHDESSKYKVLLKPTFGKHRPDQNAVFAFAEGYELRIYITFIESLRKTSFNGDIVLSVSHLDKLKPGVEEYLRERSKDSHVIVYTVDWECFNKSGTPVPDSRGGVAHCKVDHMFGTSDGKSVEDPRIPRPVATARYDIYWVWALQYQPHSQILLIDARDAYFQSDPFSGLKSSSKNTPSGILILYGENKVAVNIAKSKYNCNWIKGAYGTGVLAKISNHTISCSGSTIGEQVAIESYLRAMIQQFEETSCKMKGCDQGFHNYLFRMNLLEGAAGISKVIFHDQGEGNVNNLGAMREKPLTEWGILDKNGVVTNWDGSTSPVVHQFDRDQELNELVNIKRRSWVKEWNDSKNK